MDLQDKSASSAQLLDKDGELSSKLLQCLIHIFSKYCSPAFPVSSQPFSSLSNPPDPGAFLDEVGLDRWAQDTNGAPFTQETKDELRESFDVTDKGHLTFKGFLQLYTLQTENDEGETWQDLSKHGFDRGLNLNIS